MKVYMVTELFTPYKENGCTENPEITLFTGLHKAVAYIRGTDSGGAVSLSSNRVKVTLKTNCKPEYDIDTYAAGIGMVFKVKESCIAEDALKYGGYVYEIILEEREVR